MATLPPPDVAMDISSPGHRMDQDDDIEIDISDYPIAFELTDDEQMVDGEMARPDTATDENMDDDEPINIIHEEVMTDEPLLGNTITGNDFDDELIDYDDDQPQQPLAVTAFPSQSQTGISNNVETLLQVPPPPSIDMPETETASQRADVDTTPTATGISGTLGTALVQQDPATAEHAAPSQPSAEHDKVNPTTFVDVQQDKATIGAEEPGADINAIEGLAGATAVIDQEATLALEQQPEEAAAQHQRPEEGEQAVQQQQQQQSEEEATLAQQQPSAEDDTPQASIPSLSVIETGVGTSTDILPSPTDTGLHPVMVKYRSTEFPLFKSRMALNGLLENDNIVNVSLSELMATCREQLGINTGEKISDDQELCLKIDYMRSSLREHEPRAFEFSLQDVLDTFVQLHQNDGTKHIPALWLTIELTWNFSKLVKDMRTAAADGYGMSNFEYVNSANDDYYQNDQPDEAEHDQASVDQEYYEPDEEYADEFEEDEAEIHVDTVQPSDHDEPHGDETREEGTKIRDVIGTGDDTNGQSTPGTAVDESAAPAESNHDLARHLLVDYQLDDGNNNDKELSGELTSHAAQVEIEGSPATSAIHRAASTGDANDSAYAASNTEVQSTNHEKHPLAEEADTEAQSDNEFDDAAEVYDAIGEGNSAGEVDGIEEFDEQQEASFGDDHGGEVFENATIIPEATGKGNTLHSESQDAGATHAGSSITADVAIISEPEPNSKSASESAAVNEDLIEYDDDEPVLRPNSDEQDAVEESGAATGSTRADATSESGDTLQSKESIPKYQSPRSKRRLEAFRL